MTLVLFRWSEDSFGITGWGWFMLLISLALLSSKRED